MRTIPATNIRGNFLYSFSAAWPLFLMAALLLAGFQAPAKAQQAQGVALAKAKTSVAQKAPTASKHSPTRSAATPDWREELVRASGAPVTIVEFFDYQCPFCLKANPALEEAVRKRPGKVRLVLKHLPLASHPDAVMAIRQRWRLESKDTSGKCMIFSSPTSRNSRCRICYVTPNSFILMCPASANAWKPGISSGPFGKTPYWVMRWSFGDTILLHQWTNACRLRFRGTF